jgi:geranylgeranyl diphosphate synthase type II
MNTFLEYYQDLKPRIDNKLKQLLANKEPLLEGLHESIQYTLFSGGKRIRPLFCFMVGELFNTPQENLIHLACSLEMIHTSSLIMDDLPHMDDAGIRRGKPANHVVYGQDVAALASIGLLTKAYEIVLSDAHLADAKKTMIVKKLAEAVGINGMVGGQYVDLKYSEPSMERATLQYIHVHKTASLFVASGASAAIIGDATAEEINAIETYAKNLGFAFQVMDDLKDINGKVEETGKSMHQDNGSFAILYGEKKSKDIVNESANKAIEAISLFDGKNDKFIELSKMLLGHKS